MLGEAPDLLDDVTFQLGIANPRVKADPKASSQIKRNYLGVTTTRMRRSTENDYLPLEAIHPIDGNLQTCWMSRSQTRPDAQPIWIRFNFPVECELDRIVLHKRTPDGLGKLRRRVVGKPNRHVEKEQLDETFQVMVYGGAADAGDAGIVGRG